MDAQEFVGRSVAFDDCLSAVEWNTRRGFKLHLPVWRNGGCHKRNIEERDDGETVVGR